MSEIRKTLCSKDFINKHRLVSSAFTRQRKLPFHVLVLFLANFIKGSLQDELDQCFQAIFRLDVAFRFVTRSALSQARRKLSYRVFLDLLDVITGFVNQHGQPLTFNGMRVFAIDGSTFRVPNRPQFAIEFGVTNTPKTNRAMARISVIHDVLNRITYDAILEPYTVMENAMAYQHIEEADLPEGSLIILDRYYADSGLLEHILENGHHFCIRLKSNLRIYKAFNRLDVNDAVLTCKWLKDDSGKARQVRLVRYQIGKEVYVLMTTLLDQRSVSSLDLCDLYHQRWEVEESYKVKKCRIKIEEVRGLTPDLVRQDFYAKIFSESLTAAFMLSLEPEVRDYSDRRENEYKISFTQALAKMKNTLVLLFLRAQVAPILSGLESLFLQSLVPCVPGRKYKRRHPGKNARKIQTNSMGYTYNR